MKTKRFLSLLLALVMSLALAAPAFAADPGDSDEGGIVIQPRFNYLVVDSPVSTSTLAWDQPSGYKYYRMWVHNTGTETMYVTLQYPNGSQSTQMVAVGENKVVFSSTSAAAGLYLIDFDASGSPTGTVRVRISNTSLPDD